jgi:hypothetical protein
MRISRPKLNYANVIATLALFVALGGAAVAAGLPKNSVGPLQLKRNAVTTKALKRGAVTAGKIAPQAVVAGKLGANAVLPGNLGNGIINTEKLGDSAVIASKIRNGAITTTKLSSDAVTSGKLADGAVTTNRINNGAVTSAKLDDGAINAAKLNDGSVSLTKLGKGVVGQLQTGQLESGQTLRGTFAVGGGSLKTEKNEEAWGAVTYQFPLASRPAPTVAFSPTPNCPGFGFDGLTPLAAPGHLCLYPTGYANINTAEPLSFVSDSRFGFGLLAQAKDAGNAFALYGLWAVTAP